MNNIDKELLASVADLHSTPLGSYNIRKNGESVERNSTKDIEIISKKDRKTMLFSIFSSDMFFHKKIPYLPSHYHIVKPASIHLLYHD